MRACWLVDWSVPSTLATHTWVMILQRNGIQTTTTTDDGVSCACLRVVPKYHRDNASYLRPHIFNVSSSEGSSERSTSRCIVEISIRTQLTYSIPYKHTHSEIPHVYDECFPFINCRNIGERQFWDRLFAFPTKFVTLRVNIVPLKPDRFLDQVRRASCSIMWCDECAFQPHLLEGIRFDNWDRTVFSVRLYLCDATFSIRFSVPYWIGLDGAGGHLQMY